MLRIWNFLCSLKLAITLASLATLSIMIGSLWVPGTPSLFGQLDTLALGDWLQGPGAGRLGLSWWVYFACLVIVLFGINTLCCFIDWALNVRSRWRKMGEYLLHLGFCLVLAAYIWGSFTGVRSKELSIAPGTTRPLPIAQGFYLTLEEFTPRIENGRPLDFPQQLVLRRGDTILTRQKVRLNHPLIWKDLVIIPSNYTQRVDGFHFNSTLLGRTTLLPGHDISLPNAFEVSVVDFFPHVVRQRDGRIRPFGDQLGNPAYLLQLNAQGKALWRGWYLLREGLPGELRQQGLDLQPISPLATPISQLTISSDPGAPLAAAGGVFMALGVCLAMISFYAKRRRGERPEIL